MKEMPVVLEYVVGGTRFFVMDHVRRHSVFAVDVSANTCCRVCWTVLVDSRLVSVPLFVFRTRRDTKSRILTPLHWSLFVFFFFDSFLYQSADC